MVPTVAQTTHGACLQRGTATPISPRQNAAIGASGEEPHRVAVSDQLINHNAPQEGEGLAQRARIGQ